MKAEEDRERETEDRSATADSHSSLLIRFEHAAAFRERAASFLLSREADHNLILGITGALMQQPSYSHGHPYLAVVERDDAILAAAVMTPPHNLTLSHTTSSEALAYLARDLAATYPYAPGVLGPTHESAAFAKHWKELTGKGYRLNMAQRIYQLDHVIPVAGVSGQLRRATEADRELLLRWFAAFDLDAKGKTNPIANEASVNRFLGNNAATRGMYLWEDGQPVAMAGYSGPTPNGMRVSAVYTPRQQRGRGYASACVAAVSQLLLDSGRHFLLLFTDLANPTSNHIYQTIGYQPVCDMDEYVFDE